LSISPTFYDQVFLRNSIHKKLQTKTGSVEKLHETLSYENAARKMLAELTPGFSKNAPIDHIMQKIKI